MARFKDGKFTSYSVKDGLFDNGVFRVLEDTHGYFWISCSRGVYRVSKRDLNAFAEGKLKKVASTAYGKIDGMQSIECNGGVDPSGIKTRDGKLWFPTRDGVVIIDPDSVAHDSVPPSVMIETAEVDNCRRTVNAPLRIPPGKPNVEINYTAAKLYQRCADAFPIQARGAGHRLGGCRRAAHRLLFTLATWRICFSRDRGQ